MNVDDLIRQEVANVLAETRTNEAPTAPPVAAANAPITMTIQGKQVTFRDQADLEQQLNATAQAIAAQNAQLAANQPPQHIGSRVTDDEDSGPKFNNDDFIERMNKDPKDAINYALSHLMFEGKVDDAAGLIRETMVNQAAQSKKMAVYEFRDQYRDVPLDNPQVNNIIETTRKELGLPFNSKSVEAAYIYAVGKGQLPNYQLIAQQNARAAAEQQGQQTQGYGYPQPQSSNPYLQGPPQTGRSGGGAAPVLIGDIEDMSTEQLGRLLQNLHNQGVG